MAVALDTLKPSRRAVLRSIALGAPAIILSSRGWAAGWPQGTITLIVPFAPGGSSDLVARVLAGPLTASLGQTVVVKNRAGAGANIGIGDVARARPDGYTFLVTSSAFVVNPSLYPTVPYDPFKDFSPVADLGAAPNSIVTAPTTGMTTLADMIAKAKANPTLLNYSSPGTGTTPQLAMELVKLRAGINVVHVPYDGAGPAMVAVIGGQTQLGALAVSGLIGQVKSGALRMLAQTGAHRWPDLGNVPTLTEAGIADAESETFQAMLAPVGTPQPIVASMSQHVIAALQLPDVRGHLTQAGFGVTAGGPDILKARLAREVPMWRAVIEKAGIKVG
jgi:tripartite-type tricarboxylate transporter receptor subunit TctC